jgi:alkylation response protein AidB-like acyl-CoA dehydrogenase
MEMGPHVLGSSPLGPAVGIAAAALADYIAITRERVSLVLGTPVADSDLVQARLAESAAEVYAADLIARTDFALLHRKGKAGRRLTEREKIDVQRNRGFIAELSMRSVTRLVRMMGASGVFDDNPLNRYYRDLHTMTTQVGVAWDTTMPHWGRWALGLPPRGVMAPRPPGKSTKG